MENGLIPKKEGLVIESVVIPDECGDSMWDAVLQEEIKTCYAENIPKT